MSPYQIGQSFGAANSDQRQNNQLVVYVTFSTHSGLSFLGLLTFVGKLCHNLANAIKHDFGLGRHDFASYTIETRGKNNLPKIGFQILFVVNIYFPEPTRNIASPFSHRTNSTPAA